MRAFTEVHTSLSKQRKSYRNHKSPGQGVRGVRGAPERFPQCPAPAFCERSEPLQSIAYFCRPRRSERPGRGWGQQAATSVVHGCIVANGACGAGDARRKPSPPVAPCCRRLTPRPAGGCPQRGFEPPRFPTAKLFPSWLGGVGRFQQCEKRLVPPSAGNRAHLSKHISTCQRDL